MQTNDDTIAAKATPTGRGGVGIVRVSGNQVSHIAQIILGKIPQPRYAGYYSFKAEDNTVIDQGIALFFPGPNSFTGEDILEFQGHGSEVALDILLSRVLKLGARLARPGEFSERAFLNGKIDLTQAEAIADLIDSGSQQAARAAMNSLQGVFSQKIYQLVEDLTHLRMYVEAAIDFPEEEVDFLADKKISDNLQEIMQKLIEIRKQAQQGRLLKEGMSVVIIGKPNVGKSTLLNQLSGYDSAIVTDIPGTTRDILREHINIDGLPLHIIDTAGIRESSDQIEMEGVKRARKEMEKADHLLWMIDSREMQKITVEGIKILAEEMDFLPHIPMTLVLNKIDLNQQPAITKKVGEITSVYLSAKSGVGVDLLREHLKKSMGYTQEFEGMFIARRRHLDALDKANEILSYASKYFKESKAGELLAEDLRIAQQLLSEITGEFTSDDLLGRIFSSFCIGK